jgi:hypothetical protein
MYNLLPNNLIGPATSYPTILSQTTLYHTTSCRTAFCITNFPHKIKWQYAHLLMQTSWQHVYWFTETIWQYAQFWWTQSDNWFTDWWKPSDNTLTVWWKPSDKTFTFDGNHLTTRSLIDRFWWKPPIWQQAQWLMETIWQHAYCWWKSPDNTLTDW